MQRIQTIGVTTVLVLGLFVGAALPTVAATECDDDQVKHDGECRDSCPDGYEEADDGTCERYGEEGCDGPFYPLERACIDTGGVNNDAFVAWRVTIEF